MSIGRYRKSTDVWVGILLFTIILLLSVVILVKPTTYVKAKGYAFLDTDSYIVGSSQSDDGITVKSFNIYMEKEGEHTDKVDGITYDAETNTMTLDNVVDDSMSFSMYNMGSDFKIKIIGKCEIASMYVVVRFEDAACLTFTGDGTLTMNKTQKGAEKTIWIQNYNYNDGEGVLQIDKDVNLNLYPGMGSLYATVCVSHTRSDTKEKAIAIGGNVTGDPNIIQAVGPQYKNIVLNRLSLGSKGAVPVCKNKETGAYYYFRYIDNEDIEGVPNQYVLYPILLENKYADGPIVVRQDGEVISEKLFGEYFEKCSERPNDLDAKITTSISDGQLCIDCYAMDSAFDFTLCKKDGKNYLADVYYEFKDMTTYEMGYYWRFFNDYMTPDEENGRYYDDDLGIIITTNNQFYFENTEQNVKDHNDFVMDYINDPADYTVMYDLETDAYDSYEQYKTLQNAGYELVETECYYDYVIKTPLIVTHTTHTPGAWQYDENAHWRYCTVCDAMLDSTGKTGISEPHVWGEGVITTPASSSSEGVRTYTCVCGATKTEAVKYEGSSSQDGSGTTVEDKTKTDTATSSDGTTTDANTKVEKDAVIKDTTTGATYKVIETSDTGTAEVEYKPSADSKETTVTIPSTVAIGDKTVTVTSIADDAFAGNTTVTKVIIPATVKEIGKDAFAGCTNVKTVTINSTAITKISSGAFKNCKKLTKITITKNVKTIGKDAFSGDKKLKTITINSTKIKSIGKNAFKNVPKSATVKVPKKQKKAYTKLLKNAGYKGKIKAK